MPNWIFYNYTEKQNKTATQGQRGESCWQKGHG